MIYGDFMKTDALADLYKQIPKAETVKTKLALLPSKKAYLLCILIGCLSGNIIIATLSGFEAGLSILSSDNIGSSLIRGLSLTFVVLIIGIPFSLVIGSIPAFLTMLMIQRGAELSYQYIYAFICGGAITFLFFLLVAQSIDWATNFAIIGALSAIMTRFFISKTVAKPKTNMLNQ